MQLSCTSTWWLDFFRHVICNTHISTCSEPDVAFIHSLTRSFAIWYFSVVTIQYTYRSKNALKLTIYWQRSVPNGNTNNIISRRCSRSSDYAILIFHVVLLQGGRGGGNLRNVQSFISHVQSLLYSLNISFGIILLHGLLKSLFCWAATKTLVKFREIQIGEISIIPCKLNLHFGVKFDKKKMHYYFKNGINDNFYV